MNKGETNLYIGTSGWSYPHWEGIFYPKDLAKKKQLEYFAKHFNTVELNSSFYHLPKESTFANWYERTPKDFLFSVKVSRFISHVKYLKDCKEPWLNFYQRAKLLKEKLGPFLIQLPPNWKKDLERLRGFIKMIKEISPKERLAFEFRNESWFSSEVYQFFKAQKNLSFCIADSAIWPKTPEPFGDFVYIRFHGPGRLYGSDYSKEELKEWSRRIKDFLKEGLNVYCYFNNDFQGFALENAKELLKFHQRSYNSLS